MRRARGGGGRAASSPSAVNPSWDRRRRSPSSVGRVKKRSAIWIARSRVLSHPASKPCIHSDSVEATLALQLTELLYFSGNESLHRLYRATHVRLFLSTIFFPSWAFFALLVFWEGLESGLSTSSSTSGSRFQVPCPPTTTVVVPGSRFQQSCPSVPRSASCSANHAEPNKISRHCFIVTACPFGFVHYQATGVICHA